MDNNVYFVIEVVIYLCFIEGKEYSGKSGFFFVVNRGYVYDWIELNSNYPNFDLILLINYVQSALDVGGSHVFGYPNRKKVVTNLMKNEPAIIRT